MYPAAGAVCITGATTLTIHAREAQYLRDQNDASANTVLPLHFSTRKKKLGTEREQRQSLMCTILQRVS